LFLVAVFLFWLRYIQDVPQRPTRNTAVLITGCDTGIGSLLAQQFAKNGVTVFAGCLTEQGIQAVTADSEHFALRSTLFPFQLDVTNESSVANALQFVQQKLPENIDSFSLINNAGIHRGFFVEMTPIHDYRQTMEVNFFGMVNVTKTFLPLIRKYKGKGSRIITITSIAGRVANFGMSTYASSKFASEAFLDALRLELRQFKIPVIIIEPAFALTPLVHSVSSLVGNTLDNCPDEVLNWYGGRQTVLDKSERFCRRVVKSAFPVQRIVTRVIDAYGAIYPKHRYPVGGAAFLLVVLMNLPSEIMDRVLLSTWK